LSLALATFTIPTVAPAPAEERPATLKTQRVTFKLVREDPDIKGLDRAIELVQIPPGKTVLKGPDGKDQEHVIKSIWMAQYETRWDEYNVFWLGLDISEEEWIKNHRTPSHESGRWERPGIPYQPPFGSNEKGEVGISGYPASCIHFQAALRYCTWLSGLTGKRFRLPTEAEWEYACRAGGPPVNLDVKALAEVAWFAGNSNDAPHSVGQKRPNPWGLYDMLGNVGEYVIRDPADSKGLIAGGTWSDDARHVHSGAREAYSRKWQKNDPQDPPQQTWFDYDLHRIGFRVVMEE
jgi:formylglycine-generating enzyme required for sulfatase activity